MQARVTEGVNASQQRRTKQSSDAKEDGARPAFFAKKQQQVNECG